MSDSLVTAELLRAFNLFVHDLRGPLSVAHGYLRLLREQRLDSEAERERALTHAVEALGRISRLCADASSLVHSYESTPPAGTRVSARLLADQVSRAVRERVPASVSGIPDAGMLRLASLDSVAGAMAAIVTAVAGARPRADRMVTIDAAAQELRVRLGAADEQQLLADGPRHAFDPWRGHGLAIPCACRTVERNGGMVWGVDGRQGVVGLALPLEVSS
jgi:signal transduction histidine kinase